MDYTCCRFVVSNGLEAYYDVLSNMLSEIGFDSFENNENYIDAYIPTSLYSSDEIERVIKEYPLCGVTINYNTKEIANKDWNLEWESQFQPISINKDIYIHSSSFAQRDDVRYDITVNPRMSFGSGSHTTTRMVLQMMLRSEMKGKSVLDLGCGTGILGILARLQHCSHLTCLDIDSNSIRNTKENMELNGVSADFIQEGSIDSLPPSSRFDVILSNIHLNIHITLMSQYYNRLKSNGEILLSGFFTEDLRILSKKAVENGFKIVEMINSDDWSAIRCIKN